VIVAHGMTGSTHLVLWAVEGRTLQHAHTPLVPCVALRRLNHRPIRRDAARRTLARSRLQILQLHFERCLKRGELCAPRLDRCCDFSRRLRRPIRRRGRRRRSQLLLRGGDASADRISNARKRVGGHCSSLVH
jgi:hypothetical protein